MTKEIRAKYLEYLTERVNDFDYFDIDVFAEENNLQDDEADKLLELPLKVIIKEQRNPFEGFIPCGPTAKAIQAEYEERLKE